MRICKAVLACVLVAGLGGCATTHQRMAFLPDGKTNPFGKPARIQALKGADMMQGTVKLTPPVGYCIDRKSLRQDFALIARCDTLGAGRDMSGADLALITATFAPMTASDTAPDSTTLAASLAPAQLLAAIDRDGIAMVELEGETPAEGLSRRHWHATTILNGVLVRLAYYAPEIGKSAPATLQQLIDRTKARTPDAQPVDAAQNNTPGLKTLGGLFAGLFE